MSTSKLENLKGGSLLSPQGVKTCLVGDAAADFAGSGSSTDVDSLDSEIDMSVPDINNTQEWPGLAPCQKPPVVSSVSAEYKMAPVAMKSLRPVKVVDSTTVKTAKTPGKTAKFVKPAAKGNDKPPKKVKVNEGSKHNGAHKAARAAKTTEGPKTVVGANYLHADQKTRTARLSKIKKEAEELACKQAELAALRMKALRDLDNKSTATSTKKKAAVIPSADSSGSKSTKGMDKIKVEKERNVQSKVATSAKESTWVVHAGPKEYDPTPYKSPKQRTKKSKTKPIAPVEDVFVFTRDPVKELAPVTESAPVPVVKVEGKASFSLSLVFLFLFLFCSGLKLCDAMFYDVSFSAGQKLLIDGVMVCAAAGGALRYLK